MSLLQGKGEVGAFDPLENWREYKRKRLESRTTEEQTCPICGAVGTSKIKIEWLPSKVVEVEVCSVLLCSFPVHLWVVLRAAMREAKGANK